ncbi:acetyltransferase (GNAT) family protein [Kineothrix alysoides]|uniref:Acetyltransferase (GNAT) family protein n=1 Tax=Kineothrix alysoides TaxID=1469948 RepID=A0A4R1QR30_9FIRM|nr:GNAT family N-acetyltransferase [Kineothrix alysoides]TCL56248.1 acetyltransferase (GNAT) family protein [Kineothrix alysoides]
MEYIFINSENRSDINSFIASHWLTTKMIIRGNIVDMTQVDGIAVYENSEIIALLTYTISGNLCEIISLDSLLEGRGIATELIKKILSVARQNQCSKIIAITTNDNINAMRFYQKRGFDMVRLYHNALDISRKLKPEIPFIGENDIPLQHEIEFEYDLV